MKRNWIRITIMIAIAAIIGIAIWWENRPVYYGPGTQVVVATVDTSAWVAYKFLAPNDTNHVYRVTWSQSYGTAKTVYCRAVFRNDKEKQYRLVAPWLSGMDIERNNMDDIKFEVMPLDSVVRGIIEKK